MLLRAFSPRVIVTVEPTGKAELPHDFPWVNGVALTLQENLTDLSNLQRELEEVKTLVLKDINRFNLNLREFKITIKQQFWE